MAKPYRVTAYVRFSNAINSSLVRLGMMGSTSLLTVRGRKSGKPIVTPISIFVQDQKRYLITPYGVVNWVRWVATGYFLANAAVIPIVGYISDRIGSKTIFMIALGLFTLGSALCAFAPNEQTLIAFRVLQGIGGGALLPVAMAMISRLFEPTERAGAMALLMIPLLLGPAFGPTLGGYLATNFSWNTIFTINLPIGVVAFVLSLLVLRDRDAERAANGSEEPAISGTRRFDWLGLLLAMVGFTAVVYGISNAGSDGWGDFKVLTSYLTQQATNHAKDALATCVAQAGQHLQPAVLKVCAVQQATTLGMNDTFFFIPAFKRQVIREKCMKNT